jgi:hypothetical protein
MATNQVTLTQYSDNHTYCRFWDDSAGAFVPASPGLDAESLSIGGTPFELWDELEDIVYIGRATTFKVIGFKMAVAGAGYGTFSFEYSVTQATQVNVISATQGTKTFELTGDMSKLKDNYKFTIDGSTANDREYTCNGDATFDDPNTSVIVDEALGDETADGHLEEDSIWGTLTASVWFNSTEDFTEDGWLAWTIQGDWGLSTIDTVSAFWVRAYQTDDASTPAEAYHLMRNVTLAAPLHSNIPTYEIPRMYRDINGIKQKTDLTYDGPTSWVLDVTQIAATHANNLMLQHWLHNEIRVYIQDLARTTASPDLTADAYYSVMQGFLESLPPPFLSPGKMGIDPGAYYPLRFSIDTLTETVFSRMGGT